MLVGTQFFAYHCHHSPFGPRGTPQNLAGSKKLESHSHLAVSEWLGRADNPSVWRKMTSSTIPPRMLRHTRQLPPMPITLVQDKNWSCWWAMLKPKPKINFIDRDLARQGPDLVSGYPPLMILVEGTQLKCLDYRPTAISLLRVCVGASSVSTGRMLIPTDRWADLSCSSHWYHHYWTEKTALLAGTGSRRWKRFSDNSTLYCHMEDPHWRDSSVDWR